MTQDEIIEMAKEAGLTSVDKKSQYLRDCLERFAKLVAEKATEEANARSNASWTLMCKKMVAAEREACVQIVEREASQYTNPVWAVEIVNDIFERGQE